MTLHRQTYSQDLKMAHYMKVPPRTTFSCQVAASIWACFVQIAVMNWTLGNIDGVCEAYVLLSHLRSHNTQTNNDIEINLTNLHVPTGRLSFHQVSHGVGAAELATSCEQN